MKISMDSIKNMDWKDFGVRHGEKIALGFVGIMVALILWKGTDWETYKAKKPSELVQQVQDNDAALIKATWPVEEQKVYTDEYNVNTVYDNTYSDVIVNAFQYPLGEGMFWPLHRKQEPIEEPTWLTIQDLIATPGRFVLELPPPGEEPITDGALALTVPNNGAANATSREEALQKSFGPAGGNRGGEGGNIGIPGCGADIGPCGGGLLGCGDDMMTEASGTTGEIINAVGKRYIAVRGVFPFREQALKVMNARHEPMNRDPWELVDLLDFEIQRQTAKPGPNPWSDKDKDWNTVDQTVSMQVLQETVDYAEEIVDYSNVHYVLTSPLPMRLVGSWTPYFVGHPKLKTLSEREQEYRRILNEQLVLLQSTVEEDKAAVRGFAGAQRDMQGVQDAVTGDRNQRLQLLNNLKETLSQNTPEGGSNFQMPAELETMINQTAQAPDYYLFRFFDFDVEPGEAYRYRVRVRLRNPNYNELPENLAAENVGKGETRDTPWSQASAMAMLPDDSKFFVADVLPARGAKEAIAKVDLYQWISDIGTTARKVVDVQAGQLIGQPEAKLDEDGELVDQKDEGLMVDILRPWQSFLPEPMKLMTSDAVVDLPYMPGRVGRDFHQDLDIRGKQREWQGAVRPLEQILIVNEYGELENRNPIGSAKEHQMAAKLLSYEYGPWEYLKELAKAAEETGELDCMEGAEGLLDGFDPCGGEASGAGARGAKGRSKRRGANPLRYNRGGNLN